MRIAFLNSSIDEYGGIQRRMIELGERLERKGHQVVYYSWHYDRKRSDERYKEHIVKEMPLGFLVRSANKAFHARIGSAPPNFFGIPISALTNALLVMAAIRDCRPDFVYLSSGHALAGFVAKIYRTRLICYYVIETFSYDSILTKFMWPFERYTARHSVPFTNSQFFAAYLRKRLAIQNVNVMYGGGNISNRYKIRRKDDGRTLLYLARFSPERRRAEGHNFLLKTLSLVSDSDVRLILAGGLRKGLERHLGNLKKTANRLGLQGRVEFVTNIGRRGALELYSKATIYVDPNAYDYSISIVEALEAGVPVLTRKEGGQAELVTDGETGFHLGRSPEEWAGAISSLLKNPTLISEMSNNAKLSARNFSWDRASEILESRMLTYLK